MTLLGDFMYLPAVYRSKRRGESTKELSFILRGYVWTLLIVLILKCSEKIEKIEK